MLERYIPYKSRRNKRVTNQKLYDLISKYQYGNVYDRPFNNDFALQEKVLEIGIGSGEFMLNYAQNNPNKIVVGGDVYIPGIANVVKNIENFHLINAYIFTTDVREFFQCYKDIIFSDIYVLFPDPWPKTKHHKRRLLSYDFFMYISNKFYHTMHIATDHAQYATSIIEASEKTGLYRVCFSEHSDSLFSTKYEQKALAQSKSIFSIQLIKNECM